MSGRSGSGHERGDDEPGAAMRGWSARDLADAAGTTVRTIHYYVAEGVLPPPEGQRRSAVYPEAHLARLRLVALLRDEGLSLAAIRARVSALDDAQAQAIAAELARLLAQDAEGISVLALFEAALTDLHAPTDANGRPATAFSYRNEHTGRPTAAHTLRERAGSGANATPAASDGDAAQAGCDAPELDSATAYVERLLAARRRAIRPQRPIVPHAPPAPPSSPASRPGAPRPQPQPQPQPRPQPQPQPQPRPQPQPPFSGPVAPAASLPLPLSLPVETWHTLTLEDGIELRVRDDRMQPVRDVTAHADAATQIQRALETLRAVLRGPDSTTTAPPPTATSPTQADRPSRADRA